MAKYRVWYGDEPEYKKVSSLADALKYFRKHDELEEDESGIEELIDGEWDEWLDEDDQNVHEHLYMYGGKSAYLRSDEDEDDDDFDDDEEIDDDVDENDEGDMEDRLMNVIGGNAKVKVTEDNSDEENTFDDDDEDDFDDGDDEDDFDDEEE